MKALKLCDAIIVDVDSIISLSVMKVYDGGYTPHVAITFQNGITLTYHEAKYPGVCDNALDLIENLGYY